MTQSFILLKPGTGTARDVVIANLVRFLGGLSESFDWCVEVKRHQKRRSDQQRKALFGAAYKACMTFMGLSGASDKDELHRFWCGEFFGWKEGAFGQKTPVRTTTKDEHGSHNEIDVKTALEMYEFIQRRSAEVGCYVPDPDPFWMEKE
jgi:hypothetical protein